MMTVMSKRMITNGMSEKDLQRRMCPDDLYDG
jgi:hypothetical protein